MCVCECVCYHYFRLSFNQHTILELLQARPGPQGRHRELPQPVPFWLPNEKHQSNED